MRLSGQEVNEENCGSGFEGASTTSFQADSCWGCQTDGMLTPPVGTRVGSLLSTVSPHRCLPSRDLALGLMEKGERTGVFFTWGGSADYFHGL